MQSLALAVSVCLLLTATEALAVDDPGLVDPYVEYKARGTELFAAGNYDEAMKAFVGAYAIRKDRELLYEMGRTARQLGRSRAALEYLQRFLVDEPAPPTPRGVEAARMVRELVAEQARGPVAEEGTTPPASPRAVPPRRASPSFASGSSLPDGVRLLAVKVEKRSNGPLIAAGGMVLGLSYATALASGVWMMAFNRPTSTSSSGSAHYAGGVLVVPILGPLITGLVYREASWGVPWALLDGSAQIAGMVMMIVGARDKHDVIVPHVGAMRLGVVPWGNRDGGGLTALGVF